MKDFIADRFYLVAMHAVESCKFDPSEVGELRGMVLLAKACGFEVANGLADAATDKWIDRYGCKPDADFKKAVGKLARHLMRAERGELR